MSLYATMTHMSNVESEHMSSWPPGETFLPELVRDGAEHRPLVIAPEGASVIIGCACGEILHMHLSNMIRFWDQHRREAE